LACEYSPTSSYTGDTFDAVEWIGDLCCDARKPHSQLI
jgi:hypothetical protein